MESFDLKTLIKEMCSFKRFRDGILYYQTESGFVFKIPVGDTAGGELNAEER